MRKILLMAFGCMIALPALTQIRNVPSSSMNGIDSALQAQQSNKDYMNQKMANEAKMDSINTYAIPAERKFAIIEYKDNDAYLDSFYVKKLITNVVTISEDGQVTKTDTQTDTATLYLSGFSDKVFVGTITWRTNAAYDTAYASPVLIDDPAGGLANWTLNNIVTYTGTTKPGVYNKTFSSAKITSSPSSAKYSFTGDMIEFFGERWQGHGNIKILIDGQQVQTIYQGANPWTTDFTRQQPSFAYKFKKSPAYNSPAAAHTIEIQTDPGNQYIIDLMRVTNYKLTARSGTAPAKQSTYATPKKKK